MHGGGRGFESHILHQTLSERTASGVRVGELRLEDARAASDMIFENIKIVGTRSIDFGLRYAKSFMMKLIRAYGGCLGIRRR